MNKEKDELVFYLKEVKGKTFGQIAKLLNMDRGNMYKRWDRARKRLKITIKKGKSVIHIKV